RKAAEYELIKSKKIPENKAAIATAREHGDLKENSEYKMAKQDQSVLMAQKALLERDLGRARVTEFKEATNETVGIGTIIEVKNAGTGSTATYTILGAWDGDPEKNIISYKTALGAALLGKKVGESAKVKAGTSEEEYSVVSIRRYIETL
ncbi:MAG TPA: GreA/GreB family elongation factor, partial [Opitutaceae bacterium]